MDFFISLFEDDEEEILFCLKEKLTGYMDE